MIPGSLAVPLMEACAETFSDTPSVAGIEFNGGFLSDDHLLTFRVKTFTSDTEGFVTHNGLGDVVLAFRGSESEFFSGTGAINDWILTDFRSNRMLYPPNQDATPTWVHRGFWEAWAAASGEIIAKVQLTCTRGQARTIYVTGHSLGGSIAYLAALGCADAFKLPVHLFSFAAPRVGDHDLNRLITQNLASAYFVIFAGDPVPHLPPIGPNFPITFKHVASIEIGPLTWGILPLSPLVEIGQNYETGHEIVYIDRNYQVKDHLPPWKVCFRFGEHMPNVYLYAVKRIAGVAPSLIPLVPSVTNDTAAVLSSTMSDTP